MDLISVIIPVYNTEKYLRRCVDSVIAQTYPQLEIILVDDGSRDSSGAICDAYQEKYENIKVIHKENGGLGLARNSGLKIATGEFITFVDSDDYIDANHIENYYVCLKSNKADVCYGGFTRVGKGNAIVGSNPLAGESCTGEVIIQEIIPRLCGQSGSYNDSIQMSVCMALYKTKIIRDYGLEFVSERVYVSEDQLFNIDYLQHTVSVCFSDDVGYMYWFNSTSLSHSYLKDRFEKGKVMMDVVSDRTKRLGIYSKCEQRILNTFVITSRVCIQAEHAERRRIGRSAAYQNIKKIVNDPELQKALRTFTGDNVRFLAKVINYFMKHKCCTCLWCIMAVRNRFGI